MKYFINKKYLIIFFIFSLFLSTASFGKDNIVKYSAHNISNYFLGIVSSSQNYPDKAYKYLEKAKSLKNRHTNFNIQYLQTLILLEKFKEAFAFSKEIWKEEELFFEVDLLLGLESFLDKDYANAKKYFERLNNLNIEPEYNDIFRSFLGNFLIASVKAAENNKEDSLKYFNKIPTRYKNIKKIQNSLLQCYFDTPEVESSFAKLTSDEEYNFSRYNFFLINYLVHKNKKIEAKKIIEKSRKKYDSNLLIKQTEDFFIKGQVNKIKSLFNCQKLEDSIAEIFYILANLYSSDRNYRLSNYYAKISLFLNNKFTPNKALLAENFYYQNKLELSKKTYSSIKSIGPIYSWYASKNISLILSDTVGTKHSISKLKKAFDSLAENNFEHYYELANFYKDHGYYEDSIKYYTKALEKIKKDHNLFHKVLDRRGTSYERIGDWKNAEKDLKESLKMKPDQAHVLNYLAYSWIEKRINIEESLEMLEQAVKLRENDGYIIDSLGWAHYINKNYTDAEKFLQRAVELKPSDPIINDHYGDTLWMVNKNIQARYFWKYALSLDDADEELIKNINKKLIFGINKNL